MKCENCFRIYESNGSCILKEVSLDITGACNDCIYLSINHNYLERKKQILLKKYSEEDNQ